MIRCNAIREPYRGGPRGLTLAETLVSMILVSGVLVAALNTAGASVTARQTTSDRRFAYSLAQSLMYEVLPQPYSDPELTTPPCGIDTGENTGTRLKFDDVDDYTDWSSSPPQTKDGTPMEDLNGWSSSVKVEWVRADDTKLISLLDRGVKRITVTVSKNNVPLATLVALRAGESGATLSPLIE